MHKRYQTDRNNLIDKIRISGVLVDVKDFEGDPIGALLKELEASFEYFRRMSEYYSRQYDKLYLQSKWRDAVRYRFKGLVNGKRSNRKVKYFDYYEMLEKKAGRQTHYRMLIDGMMYAYDVNVGGFGGFEFTPSATHLQMLDEMEKINALGRSCRYKMQHITEKIAELKDRENI